MQAKACVLCKKVLEIACPNNAVTALGPSKVSAWEHRGASSVQVLPSCRVCMVITFETKFNSESEGLPPDPRKRSGTGCRIYMSCCLNRCCIVIICRDSGAKMTVSALEMPGRGGGPVCLTRSAPFDVGSSQLVFFDVIDINTTARSSALSCIAKAGGEAKLPDTLTLSDFKIWIKAVDDTPAKVARESFSMICTVLKVPPAYTSLTPVAVVCRNIHVHASACSGITLLDRRTNSHRISAGCI